ncbi:MAG TPA: neutral zinc metallopeptidase [Myxococcaceae bacterium]|nr:neutral zinc metallopeptidase [Myxococcaceae bacterium]
MDWESGRRSDNVEDRRGMGRPVAIGGGATLIVLILGLLFGFDPSQLLALLGQTDTAPSGTAQSTAPVQGSPAEERQKDFVSFVLASTEDTWPSILAAQGVRYVPPKLVLFRGGVESACGFAESASGPFYCPLDQMVFLDLAFFDELARRFGAPGDFAQAYVVAHEIGHHVQKQLGIFDKTDALRRRGGTVANQVSVLQELQADCFAGVWANQANRKRPMLQAGDVEAGLRAAAAVGDDTIQRRARGYVVPESFTHGSAEQRTTWFRRGFESGQIDACDTFAAR